MSLNSTVVFASVEGVDSAACTAIVRGELSLSNQLFSQVGEAPEIQSRNLSLKRLASEADRLILAQMFRSSAMDPLFDSGLPPRTRANRALLHQQGFIEETEDHYNLKLAVYDSDNRLVGSAGLWFELSTETVFLSYAIHPGAQGLGYATEAAEALRDYARDNFAIEEIAASVNFDNTPSIRVLEKLGMTRSIKYESESTERQGLIYYSQTR